MWDRDDSLPPQPQTIMGYTSSTVAISQPRSSAAGHYKRTQGTYLRALAADDVCADYNLLTLEYAEQDPRFDLVGLY